MRAKDLEITDQAILDSILKKASICRLSMAEDNHPYAVPLCFGYDGNTLYIHSGPGGKKLKILARNPEVCFLIDVDHKLVTSGAVCDFEFKYRSIVGYGQASFLEDPAEKQKALKLIVGNYTKQSPAMTREAVDETVVLRIDIERMTGRVCGY